MSLFLFKILTIQWLKTSLLMHAHFSRAYKRTSLNSDKTNPNLPISHGQTISTIDAKRKTNQYVQTNLRITKTGYKIEVVVMII